MRTRIVRVRKQKVCEINSTSGGFVNFIHYRCVKVSVLSIALGVLAQTPPAQPPAPALAPGPAPPPAPVWSVGPIDFSRLVDEHGPGGFRVDFGFGRAFEIIHGSEPNGGLSLMPNIEQVSSL
jgi:hypothetical protein